MKRIKQFFHFQPFSRKQRKVLNWWTETSPVKDYDGIIADGAIRSGKTVSMSLSFVLWAMTTFNGQNFAMCGKTIGSFRRNVLFWLKLMLKSRGYRVADHRADNLVVVSRGSVENNFYIFGGSANYTIGSTTKIGWYTSPKDYLITDDVGDKAQRMPMQDWACGQYVTIKKGQSYTFSCDVKLDSEATVDESTFYLCPDVLHVSRLPFLDKITKNWKRITYTYIASSDGIERFHLRGISGDKNLFYIKHIKMEKGNKASDWTPAPEDLTADAQVKAAEALASAKTYADAQIKVAADSINQNVTKKFESASDETTDKLTELRQEVSSNIEQTGEAIKSSVYEKVYPKDDVDTLLSSVNTEVEQTKTSWQVTFNQLVKQLNDYSDGSDAAFDEIRKYIRFEDGNILLGNSSSPLILRIRNDRIQFLQNGYEVAYISDQRMYNTTCEIINQLRIADSAWTVETNSNGDTIVSLIGL